MVGRHSFARCGGHSLAQQTSSSGCSCSPVFAFQAVCVFARCKEAAELCSCCVPEQGEGTIGTGNMELSCPVPPAHHSVPGAVLVGTTAVLLGTAVCLVLMVVTADGDSRGEKGENVCSDVLQSVAVLTQELQTAPCTLLSQGVLMVWGTLTTRIFQGPSPLWDSHG